MSPYPGFTALNRRRLELVEQKYKTGLSGEEQREMEMLGTCVGAMCAYRWPTRDFPMEALVASIEQKAKEDK